jgi:hypothetical protein
MDWEAIGAVSEIVGAAAVVISLLYLARQVQIQNSESRAAAMHEFYAGWRESSVSFVDGELAEIFIKASSDFDSLTEIERLRLLGGLHGLIRLFEEAYFQHQQNRLDPGMWNAINRQYSSLFSNAVYIRYWEMRRDWYHEEFQRHIDNLAHSGYQL